RLRAVPARRRPAGRHPHPVPEAVGGGGGARDRVLPRPRARLEPGRRAAARAGVGSARRAARRPRAAAVIVRKTDAEVETMARAGRVVAATLDLVEERAAPGVTLAELDGIAEEFIGSTAACRRSRATAA